MKFIQTPHGNLQYRSLGTGTEVTLLLHGFGQSHEDMLAFSSLQKTSGRFIFIDMFYHGKSQWRDSNTRLSRGVWKKFLEQLMIQEAFDSFHLIGYSMGGKFSLITLELFEKEVKSLILLAPDGIKTGRWYSISSYPDWIDGLFKQLVFRPKPFQKVVKGLARVRLLDQSILKFFHTQLDSRSKRAQIYLTWRVVGALQPRLAELIRIIRKQGLPVAIFLGSYDRMIDPESIAHFAKKIPHLRQEVLPVGHGQLIDATVKHFTADPGYFSLLRTTSTHSPSRER